MTNNNKDNNSVNSNVEFIKKEANQNANNYFEQFNTTGAGLPNPLPSNSDSKNISTLAHLSMLLFWFPIVPIVLYFAYPNDEFVNENAKEDINLYITLCILYIVGTITAILLVGLFILFAGAILHIGAYIFLAIKSSEGKVYRLPSILRLIK